MADERLKCLYHQLDVVCLGCIRVIIEERDKLKRMLKSLIQECIREEEENTDDDGWSSCSLIIPDDIQEWWEENK